MMGPTKDYQQIKHDAKLQYGYSRALEETNNLSKRIKVDKKHVRKRNVNKNLNSSFNSIPEDIQVSVFEKYL